MLAWLHQATASEKEHLEALLKQVTVQGTCRSVHTNAVLTLEVRFASFYTISVEDQVG